MQLTQWTLFVDMLGYRDINGSIDNDEKAKIFMDFMEENEKLFSLTDNEEIRKKYESNKEFNLYKYYEISSCFVSDSLIITYKPKVTDDVENEDLAYMHSANALFIIAMRLQAFMFNCFKEKQLFLRGGISNKYCYIKKNFAMGEGLIEAYLAESTIAKMPRIVLHPEIEKNNKLMAKIDFLGKAMYGGHSILQRDEDDGRYFIDHLGYAISCTDLSIPMILNGAVRSPLMHMITRKSVDDYIKRHAEGISSKLKSLNSKLITCTSEEETKKIKSVIEKFDWLKIYHNKKILKHETFQKYLIT